MGNPPPLRLTIPRSWAGRTVKSILSNELRLSRGQINVLKKSGGIHLNGVPVTVACLLKGGEDLILHILPLTQDLLPERLPLSIIYEDPDLVLIDKPAGMLVHPVRFQPGGTLANALAYHWRKNNEAASFHPVHRLDQQTSGLVLVAKNPWAHQQLSLQIEENKINRLYFALCRGTPEQISGKISAPIKKSPAGIKRIISPAGKPSFTRYRAIEPFPGGALLAVKLFTGRTHQIRVHLSHLGLPLWGDPLYGCPDPEFPRPALHAVRLRFIHPRTGRRVKFTSPLPEDFRGILAKLSG